MLLLLYAKTCLLASRKDFFELREFFFFCEIKFLYIDWGWVGGLVFDPCASSPLVGSVSV